jgi:uracil-DNA glycosylase
MNNIHSSWKKLFSNYEFNLESIYDEDVEVFPKNIDDIFKVFQMDVNKIRIVLLGQDCYHSNEKQAHGLSFSVPKGVPIPPSLKNIFNEIQKEFPDRNYKFLDGDLTKWFENEYIFLLNCSLTVEKSSPGSHIEIWKEFTDDVIKYISKNNKKCVYILLGKFAENKKGLIDVENHKNILITKHPSPFSAYSGFFGSNIFKKAELLLNMEINWQN